MAVMPVAVVELGEVASGAEMVGRGEEESSPHPRPLPGRERELFVGEELVDGGAPEVTVRKRRGLSAGRAVGVGEAEDDLVAVVDEVMSRRRSARRRRRGRGCG